MSEGLKAKDSHVLTDFMDSNEGSLKEDLVGKLSVSEQSVG